MKSSRRGWLSVLALFVAVLALVAAGCGGDDEEGGGDGGSTTEATGGFPSPHLGDSEQMFGFPDEPASSAARQFALRHLTPAVKRARGLDEPSVPGLCTAPGCVAAAEFDNGPDGYHCGPHALFKQGRRTRPA